MLRRHAKAGVFVLVLAVLVVEGYVGYRWYERHHGHEAAASTPAEATAPDGAAGGRSEGTSGAGPEPDPFDRREAFVHTATDENSRGDYTYLSDPGFDGDPDAVVLAELLSPRGDGGGDDYGHNIGVWYDFADRERWAIFNQDRAAVPAGTTFRVYEARPPEGFVHRAETANTVGNSTYLDEPAVNGEPDLTLSVTQNWNPGGGVGVYNDHPVEVFYDDDVDRWAIYNADDARMPEGAAFNVAVSEKAGP